MNNANQIIDFDIPMQRQTLTAENFDIRPKKVGEWIDQLPLADVGITSKRIHRTLQALNRSYMAPEVRINLLQQFHEPIQYCTAALRKHYITRAFPLGPKGIQNAEQALMLLTEHAMGYVIVAVDLLAAKRNPDKKLLSQSIYRAMRVYAEALLTTYQIYAARPARIWGHLHKLYAIAEHTKLLDRSIKDPENKVSKFNTIEKTYKQILLVSLSNPQSLRQKEIEQIATLMEHRAQYAAITDERLDGAKQRWFCKLDSDYPPLLVHKDIESDDPNIRYLDLTRLIAVLRQEIERQPIHGRKRGSDEIDLPIFAVQRMIRLWDGPHKRSFSRIHESSPVSVSIGLEKIYSILNKNTTDEIAPKRTATHVQDPKQTAIPFADSAVEVTELSLEPLPLETNAWVSQRDTINEAALARSVSSAKKASASKVVSTTWKTINISAGGYCLLWNQEQSSPAQIGELISIREPGSQPHQWTVGVIRWMRFEKFSGLILGIQILAPAVTTGQIQAPGTSSTGSADLLPCLETPELQTMDKPATLITKSNQLHEGDTVVICRAGEKRELRIIKLMEENTSFDQFHHRYV